MRSWIIAVAFMALGSGTLMAQDPTDTRMLSQPAVSRDHIAFVYDGDLWLANRDGTDARRVTTHPGSEGNPRFSPDGNMLAFTGEYDGNADVFVVSVSGGAPTRLTWHPGADLVQDWTPDGGAVLFISQREVFTNRFTQLFLVSVDGTQPERLPIPSAYKASFSADGSRIAYTPLSEAHQQWKNYRGGRTSRIWLYDRGDQEVVQVPQPEGRCNDTDPMWFGGTVYFTSDRNGEFNVFSFDEASGEVRQLTTYDDFPVLNATAGDGVIVYEQAGFLHTLDPGSGQDSRLRVAAAADLMEVRPRWAEGSQFLRNYDLSPSGARAVFEFRGDIVTVPEEKGDHRYVTSSSDAHDRSPVWSPDGSRIAWFSDASGEYQLMVGPQDGKGEPRAYDVTGAGFYEDPKWSPDGKYISYSDNSWSLYFIDLESGENTKIFSEIQYGPQKRVFHAWSPDSRWIAHTRSTLTYFGQAWLYDVETGESRPVTDGLSDVWEPVFDAGGKYLYFFASTDAGPQAQWFAMSNLDMEETGTLYVAVLQSGEESPLKKESDEEKGSGGEESGGSGGGGGAATRGTGGAAGAEGGSGTPEVPRVEVDFDGLDQRILTIPVGNGFFTSLQPGGEGELYYIRAPAAGFGVEGQPSLRRYSFEKREEETLLEGANAFVLSHDKKKLLVRAGQSWHIAPAGKVTPAETRITAGDIQVHVDPRAEWRQMLREAWRIQRDFFYDPGMHGADWDAVWTKYEAFLPDLATRGDLRRVIQWMLSELSVGHSYGGGGDDLRESESVPGGLLGADYEVADGRYRFRKIYGGLNYNPDLRSPLTEPGVEVQEGEYLLAVNGVAVRPPENLFRHFENTAGKAVEITVGPNADGSGSRTVTVVPIGNEYGLRNRDWVEKNVQRVHEATDGKVAYVWVPNTSVQGWQYFKRYFYPQAHLDGIIVDERFNGGGSLADYVVDILRRPYMAHWTTRYGQAIRTPIAFMPGPKAMLIDETAGSGGDFLPWWFRQNELGPLVGRRTWGGLVGILGFPVLMDGGSVTAPNLAFWTEEEGYGIENVGVPPDIEVEQWPAEVAAGRDPQLERAIQEVLRMLRENPPEEPQRPPFPIRVRR
jgi:tricorn protease